MFTCMRMRTYLLLSQLWQSTYSRNMIMCCACGGVVSGDESGKSAPLQAAWECGGVLWGGGADCCDHRPKRAYFGPQHQTRRNYQNLESLYTVKYAVLEIAL